jgi:hypothetical protein
MDVFLCENTSMKRVEIEEKGEGRKTNGGGKSNIHCKHICKYQNVTPLQLLYANNFFKSNDNLNNTCPPQFGTLSFLFKLFLN